MMRTIPHGDNTGGVLTDIVRERILTKLRQAENLSKRAFRGNIERLKALLTETLDQLDAYRLSEPLAWCRSSDVA